jgi:hypothetical protein
MLRFRHEEIIVLGFGVVCWENMVDLGVLWVVMSMMFCGI